MILLHKLELLCCFEEYKYSWQLLMNNSPQNITNRNIKLPAFILELIDIKTGQQLNMESFKKPTPLPNRNISLKEAQIAVYGHTWDSIDIKIQPQQSKLKRFIKWFGNIGKDSHKSFSQII